MGAPPQPSGCCSGCCGGQQQLTSAQLVASFQRAVEKLQKAIQSTGRQSGGDSAFWIVAQLYAHKVRDAWLGAFQAMPTSTSPVRH